MNADKLMDAITELDDDMLNEAAGQPSAGARAKAKAGRRSLIFTVAAAAAALAVTVGGIIAITRKPAENPPAPDDTKLVAADTKVKAQALAAPEYPEEWSYQQEENSTVSIFERPWYVRRTAGSKAADIYRSFFADTMLLLLSDADRENAVMSPVNLYMATAVLAEITNGETRAQILQALGVSDLPQLREQAAAIWGLCYKDDGREKTVLGNSLWLSNTLSYRAGTLSRLADSYYASAFIGQMGSEPYNGLLRKWINDMTGGLLSDQVSSIEMSRDTALALVSTVWHETKWDSEFDPRETKPGVFHSPGGDIETEMMYSAFATNEVYAAEKYTLINKTTRQGNVWFFLPDEGVSVADMMQEESFRDFIATRYDYRDYFGIGSDGSWQGKTYHGITGAFARVNLTVPKLDISNQQDVTEALRKMGITTAFDAEKADYTPITDQPGVFLQKAVQGTRLIMDEEGVSAASYVLMLAGSVMLEDEIELVFDRPFFIMITGAGEVPLFAGVVNEP